MNIKEKLNNFFSALKLVFTKSNKKIVLGIGLLVLSLVVAITFSVNLLANDEEVKSVEFESSGWAAQEPGSWHITKSAEWTGVGTAQIQFDIDTMPKYTQMLNHDVVFAIDVSTSMYYSGKITSLKESLKRYISEILKDENNRIAIVEYHTTSSILSDFTNNAQDLNNIVDNITLKCEGEIIDGVKQDWGYCTNYYAGLQSVEDVLKDYTEKDNRKLTVLFLTDGNANRDTGGIQGQYTLLKEKYQDIVINGIQYEMGSTINEWLKQASDKQYDAYVDNIYDIFSTATYEDVVSKYEKFVLTDFIDERYFELGEIENVNVSIGEANLSIEGGQEKITWDLGTDYKTGSSATMTIDVKLKDVTISENMLFPTNRKEDVEYKILDEPEEAVHETVTPILKNGFNVIYDANPPSGCNIKADKKETYLLFDNVTINNDDLSGKCSGYAFKGWEITDDSSDGVRKINDDSFVMPNHDVYIKGTWTQLSISKFMTGEEGSAMSYVLPFNEENAFLDSKASTYVASNTGIDFNQASSDTNGKGLYVRAGTEKDEYPIYYYRGDVENNNVLFANKCWKIVRTTETGGTKLIYNGLPNENNTNGVCANYGSNSILEETYFDRTLTLSALGYMRNESKSIEWDGALTRSDLNSGSVNVYSSVVMNGNDNYYFSTSYTKVGGSYKLVNAKQLGTWTSIYRNMTGQGYYTCKDTTSAESTCSKLYYIRVAFSGSIYAIELQDSQDFEQVNKLTLASEIILNSDETVSLAGDVITISRYDWYSEFSNYNDFYICADLVSTTCEEIFKITSVYSYRFSYDIFSKKIFGNDVEYNEETGKYTLKDTTIKNAGITYDDFLSLESSKNYHYTCNSISDTCEEVFYIYHHEYVESSYSNYYTDNYVSLKNGMTIEELLDVSFSSDNSLINEVDSNVKDYLENTWFAGTDGMLSYDDYLEDAVWCNNREITHLGAFSKTLSFDNPLYFGIAGKKYSGYDWTPSVKNAEACPNRNDWFTVSSENGNGKSKYKVGMITADEAILAGNKMRLHNEIDSSEDPILTYLNKSNRFWTLSPTYIGMFPMTFVVQVSGFTEGVLYGNAATNIRPSVSLKQGVVAQSGDGSAANPYRVG